jgi:hypothetical protein
MVAPHGTRSGWEIPGGPNPDHQAPAPADPIVCFAGVETLYRSKGVTCWSRGALSIPAPLSLLRAFPRQASCPSRLAFLSPVAAWASRHVRPADSARPSEETSAGAPRAPRPPAGSISRPAVLSRTAARASRSALPADSARPSAGTSDGALEAFQPPADSISRPAVLSRTAARVSRSARPAGPPQAGRAAANGTPQALRPADDGVP